VLSPRLLAFFNLVQLFFQPGGVSGIKILREVLHQRSVTTSPVSVGVNLPPSFCTYWRSTIVEIIVAYVDGRPIPRSSSSFTRDASLIAAAAR